MISVTNFKHAALLVGLLILAGCTETVYIPVPCVFAGNTKLSADQIESLQDCSYSLPFDKK